MTPLRTSKDAARDWSAAEPPVEATHTARADSVDPVLDPKDLGSKTNRFAVPSFQGKAQQLQPIKDVPKSSAELGSWWGRVATSRVVKAVMLGASGLLFSVGAQATTLRRAGTIQPPNRQIVFVGMNAGAQYESGKLKQWTKDGVALVSTAKVQDHVLVDGKLLDLSTAPGQEKLATSLGLDTVGTAHLLKAFDLTGADGRDEVAQLATLFAEAEHGERVIERLVLSGHSLGSELWGDDNGEISWKVLGAIAKAFPEAARQVEDVMVAACYAGGRTQMEEFKSIFPKAKSLWGYSGTAPGSASGSVWHMKRWEKQTRGEGDAKIDRGAVLHLRKGDNVAVWTESKGYDDGQVKAPMSRLRADYNRTRDITPLFLSGERQVEHTGRGPLREHYGNLQRLLQRTELPAAERAPLLEERKMVIRLIYYKRVSGYFAKTHKQTLSQAFEAVGLKAPDFAKLSRKAALQAIRTFEQAATHNTDPQVKQAGSLLTEGLRDLSADKIPSAWL